MPKGFHTLITQEGETQNRYNYKCAVDGMRHFKNSKQYQLFIRLHRKKCESCCLSNPNPTKANTEFEFTQDLSIVRKNGSNQNHKITFDDKSWKQMEDALR
jgi:hypothetical protein|tara:strand:- start:381 stop:683 length:303 start_codon:yes stop_codon:yes gene_type:complete